jgi:hypothetical protein
MGCPLPLYISPVPTDTLYLWAALSSQAQGEDQGCRYSDESPFLKTGKRLQIRGGGDQLLRPMYDLSRNLARVYFQGFAEALE